MMIPAAVIQLDEPHISFDHATGQQAVAGERTGLVNFGSVKFHVRRALAAQVCQLGDRHLHAERQFKRLNHAFHLRLYAVALQFVAIELLHEVELPALRVERSAGDETTD